ncbi:MAG: hypothetical protein J0I29_10755 [Rhizobiales bacterium]|nr:hypothetical protein [Hyphomicrobiales bacterium]
MNVGERAVHAPGLAEANPLALEQAVKTAGALRFITLDEENAPAVNLHLLKCPGLEFQVRFVLDRFVERFAELFLDFFGTFLPSLRASESPIAMACMRLVTFLPDLPLLNVPLLRFFIARSTFFDAAFEYLRAIRNPPLRAYA